MSENPTLELVHDEHSGHTSIRGLPFTLNAITEPASYRYVHGVQDMLAQAKAQDSLEALRRLAAAWNVCAGIPTNQLEVTPSLEDLWNDAFKARDHALARVDQLHDQVARQQAALDWLVAVQGRRLAEQQAELSTARRTREQRDDLLAALRTMIRMMDGSQPKDHPGALMVANHAVAKAESQQ